MVCILQNWFSFVILAHHCSSSHGRCLWITCKYYCITTTLTFKKLNKFWEVHNISSKKSNSKVVLILSIHVLCKDLGLRVRLKTVQQFPRLSNDISRPPRNVPRLPCNVPRLPHNRPYEFSFTHRQRLVKLSLQNWWTNCNSFIL